jgi:hypothetical protein
MNDDRIDQLVRRLDVQAAPPPGFVDATYAAIRPHADRARRRQAGLGWLAGWLAGGHAGYAAGGRRAVPVALLVLLALLGVVLWASLAWVGQQPRPLGWQPRAIVFGRAHDQPPGYDLWSIGLGGGPAQLLLAGGFEPVRASPDGTRIEIPVHGSVVFPRIWNVADRSARDLHPDPTLNLGVAAWSHDGQWLAFEGWDETSPDRSGVWLLRQDGSGLHRLTGSGVPGDFSADDREVLVTRQEGLFLVNVDGTGEHQISVLKPVAYASAGFMPDGRTIYAADDGKLWLIDPATGISTPFVVPGGALTMPRVSPDGTAFVFTFDPIGAPTTAIWRMNIDGSAPAVVADDPTTNEDFADWLP